MFYPRKISQKIEKWLTEKEIIILNGPRQVGKTTLLKILQDKLVRSGIEKERIFYLNLEEIKILSDLNQDPENLLNYITKKNKTNFFFLDEVQYLDNPSNFLKHLYDKYAGKIKIIATDSSSLELKAKFQDFLVGRKVSFLVNPLDFEEFLTFKQSPLLDYFQKEKLPANIEENFRKELEEYLIYGGMPAVVLRSDKELKQKLLEEYVNTYINKDVRYIGRIEDVLKFNNVVKVLASQIGNLLNISELANTTTVSRRYLQKYLAILEHTFVLNKILPLRKNIRAQISKMPKTYFFDLGIRNAILNNFLPLANRNDAGQLFENFVFLELKNKVSLDHIYFYRTLNKTEIDFVIETGGELILIEAKYKKLNRPIDERALKSFMAKNKAAKKAVVINLNLNSKNHTTKYHDFRFIGLVVG